jgi:hypothetical protein
MGPIQNDKKKFGLPYISLFQEENTVSCNTTGGEHPRQYNVKSGTPLENQMLFSLEILTNNFRLRACSYICVDQTYPNWGYRG